MAKRRKRGLKAQKERRVMNAFLNDDDEPSLGSRAFTKTKRAIKDTGEFLGEATLTITEEAVQWVDAGFDMLVSLGNGEPKRTKRNPY